MMVTAEVWNINFCETREYISYIENEIDSETVTDYDYKRARERESYIRLIAYQCDLVL